MGQPGDAKNSTKKHKTDQIKKDITRTNNSDPADVWTKMQQSAHSYLNQSTC